MDGREQVGVEAVEAVAGKEEWTAEDARFLLEAQRASGKTVTDFARQYGFVPQRLHRWKTKLRQGKAAGREAEVFRPVRVVAPRPAGGSVLEVVVRGGRSVRVGEGVDVVLLQRVVAALEEVPC